MVLPTWHPERVVDAATARALIRAQFPQLDAATVAPLGHGYDNTAFLVDGTYVFRFPRRAISAELIEREGAVLACVAPAVPLPVPIPTLPGVATDSYPWPFAGYRILPGTTACTVDLDDGDRAALAPSLGAFLRALHAIDPRDAVARGVPGDTMGRMEHERRFPQATERLRELQARGFVEDVEAPIAFMAAHPPGECDEPRILHGDLYARHVLLDESKQACGVIDWGDAHVGDPALDLAVALTLLPPYAHASFARAYGAIDEATWKRAIYRAIYHSAMVANYGAVAGDPAMLRIGLVALAQTSAVLLDPTASLR